ncbi:porin family protein [Rhodohalobacter sp. 614A]|uniref:porin family protein n=1 Tax=Rhodohalobacter sp. 614A TaxID=2908649 RepID=UPI001F455AAD|nr:porin family protein [Rhodohalobacter sp. 614A]
MEKIISIILVTFFLNVVFFQNGFAQEHRYGIKGGITFYQIHGKYVLVQGGERTDLDSHHVSGIEAGFFAEFRVNKMFSIQPEVVFAQKGGSSITSLDVQKDINLNYIDLPVLLKFRVPVTQKFIPYIFGGPYGSILVRAQVDLGEYGSDTITDQYTKLTYGVKVGVGVEIGRFIIDGRYDLGISEIYKEDGSDEYVRGFVISISRLF